MSRRIHFSALGPRLFGFKIGHTDYRISAIPLGAYVKLYGDEVTGPLEGGESKLNLFRNPNFTNSARVGRSFSSCSAGRFMNFVLALSIPFAIALVYGVPADPSPVVGFVKADGAAEKAGLKAGDRIVSFNGMENPSWDRIQLMKGCSRRKDITACR